MMVQNRQEWENGGNIVSFERKRRELAERLEQERVDSSLSGEDPAITVLCCPCGCEALTTFTDGEHMYTECMECGEPMVMSLLAFLSGQY
jgi:ferredoxin-like protein FixX